MAESAPSAEDRSRYEAIKKELLSALPKKRAIDKQLAQIEAQIHNLEATYLNETAQHSGGNIIHGFEGYLKNQTTGRRKYEISEQDRIFSNSSLTVAKSLELVGDNDEGGAPDEYVKQPTPGVTTVILPPATRNQELTASAQQKRLRDKEYQRKKRASASMRSTGESEEEVVSTTSTSRRPNKRQRMTEDD
ncbi:hypothetical protein D9756_004864 [Leucocoprinus leucothites]|uniref:Chromatin modification-related protein EAF6 n=1 Tax=Leucocoprinus leucothites TaxID=201217 RepID=A0A8H5LKP1_9AGAR|nr:hypothetical protein D9756_004864 [Leucoagaricus leucothites]